VSDIEFEALAGLPASGPPAVPIPTNSSGVSEGYVVRFRSSSSEAWTGNFRCGDTRYSAVHRHPDERRVIAIAGGSDYLVNPETKSVEGHAADNISFSREVADLKIVVFGNHIRFWAEGKDGRKWTTPRLSWDGLEVVSVVKRLLIGRSYSAVDETWHEFRLDLMSGNVTGAIYEADVRLVIPVKADEKLPKR
jgi:hypothetical protein